MICSSGWSPFQKTCLLNSQWYFPGAWAVVCPGSLSHEAQSKNVGQDAPRPTVHLNARSRTILDLIAQCLVCPRHRQPPYYSVNNLVHCFLLVQNVIQVGGGIFVVQSTVDLDILCFINFSITHNYVTQSF